MESYRAGMAWKKNGTIRNYYKTKKDCTKSSPFFMGKACKLFFARQVVSCQSQEIIFTWCSQSGSSCAKNGLRFISY